MCLELVLTPLISNYFKIFLKGQINDYTIFYHHFENKFKQQAKKHSYLDRTIYCKTLWNFEDKSARAETMTNYFIFLNVSNVI